MKSVLYVAAALMIGASIYGFVDYNKTSHHKEFEAMYNENETADQVMAVEKTDVVPVATDVVPVVSKAVVVVKEKDPAKKEIKRVVANNSKKNGKKIKKKRTVNYEKFSRAPLSEERIIEPELKEVKEQ